MARQKKNGPNDAARLMVEAHLRFREQLSPAVGPVEHLDEDRLAAFVEGCLTEAESAPLVAHMVGCSPCRRATAQLVRLEYELGDASPAVAEAPEPGRIRRLLDSLAARVLPQSDEDAVFAYHAPAEDFEPDARATADKESDGREAEDDDPAPRA